MNHGIGDLLVRNLHTFPKNRIADFGIFDDATITNGHVRTDLGILDDYVFSDVTGHDNLGTFERLRIRLLVTLENIRVRLEQRFDETAIQPRSSAMPFFTCLGPIQNC